MRPNPISAEKQRGRKRLITFREVEKLRRHPDRLTWPQIAAKLQVSRATVWRCWTGGNRPEAA